MANKKILKKTLTAYLNRVQNKIALDKAYLVGSWAKGKAKKDSDVDILVLSQEFSKMDQDERLQILYRYTTGIDFDLHIHAVTPEELKKASLLTSLGVMERDKKISLL